MAPRAPIASDFPSSLVLTVTTPPPSAPQNSNVLLLLHGLGDNEASFTELGRQLALPETTCISVRAPTPLPFELGGFYWGDDIHFESSSGQMEFDTGFNKSTKLLSQDIIQEGLVEKCGFKTRQIMLFGFGQGGMVAMATASTVSEELGGVVSIGGPLPTSVASAKGSKSPVILLGGSSNTLVTRTIVDKVKAAFQAVEYHKWNRVGDGMPRSREEMLPIMRFFARRLQSQKGVPEGSIEIG